MLRFRGSLFWHILLILYAGLITIVFAIMTLAFPFGAYTVFNTELGESITFEYPLENVSVLKIPFLFEIGDLFIVMWCIYLYLFSMLMLRKQNILNALLLVIQKEEQPKENTLSMVIVWFSILFIASKGIILIQQYFGIEVGSLEIENLLVQFFDLTAAPLREEPAFRVLLIGLPAYMIFNSNRSFKGFLETLWRPSKHVPKRSYMIALIGISAVIFGVAHILGGGWDYGKIAQAIIGGLILGWIYYLYGLPASIMLHWSMNYFLLSYGFFGKAVWNFSWDNTLENPMLAGIDLLLTVTGIIAISIYIHDIITARFRNSFK